MGFGSSEWMNWVLDEEASIEMIGKAYDRGINFFDTANIYSNGESERILGKAIRHFQMPRGRIVVATKAALAVQPSGFSPTPKEDPAMVNLFGTSRKHLFDAVDASLARLGLDYIDLVRKKES
jgi:aryl-alcohol dehydrogenase-like predicted oxidoreductase